MLRYKTSHRSRALLLTGILSALSSSNNVFADTPAEQNTSSDNTTLCPTTSDTAIKHIRPPVFSPENSQNTEISADFTQSESDGATSLKGNVIIEKHLLRVTADLAQYDKQQDILKVSGNVHIDTESLSLDADSGTVDIKKDSTQGNFKNIKFFIPENNMKGKAESIKAGNTSNNKRSILTNASITSCDLFDPDWLISADEIRLDHDDEYGSAEDVVLRFKSVPFLYTPYIEFPTSDRRRSGLLFPEFGASSSRGIELAVPWYWNIAPNQDAVIVPRYMDKRGLELGGDYRYLTRSTNGELQGSYLHDDDITQEKRYQVRYQQHSRISSNLLLDVDLQDISDADYFNDFSSNIGTTSQTHLNRSATLRYDIDNWRARALVQDIQTIDETTAISSRPYERLPQLTFKGDTEIGSSSLLFTLDSEFVDFTHEDDTNTTGTRITVTPGIRLPLSGAAWFIDPAVKFNHTQYDVGTEAGGSSIDVENRNLPISSIDAGLFFERNLDNGYQQTLEPRLYYLNVPFEDQTSNPIFDTSIPEFSVAQLFRDNRFIGGDRVGDTNQLTVALSSRLLNPDTGDEFLRASIGQIFYFEDRKVNLSSTDTAIDTSRQSDVIAEFGANWGNWQSNIDIQWDAADKKLSRENYFLHYMSDKKHLFNIGYRKRLDINDINIVDIEQTDTSFVYAINREYTSFVRWNYSLKDKKDINSIAGIAYDSCCWSIQLLAQRRLKNTTTTSNNDDYDNSILVQFVFKGLGSLSGSSARTTLEQSIYGYTDTLQ
ncbi:MAG: LPS assembly protein LptD [Proteobacteria bacterium]|nr:LPS assembly protein LptD [Pseudomonadota bacterium]